MVLAVGLVGVKPSMTGVDWRTFSGVLGDCLGMTRSQSNNVVG